MLHRQAMQHELNRCGARVMVSHKLPAVVSEGAVSLSHLVGVFATLNRSAQTVGCIQDLICQTLDHGVLTTLTGVGDHPAQCQGVSTVWTNLDWDLVGCATNTAGTNLKVRADVAQSLFQGTYWLGAGLFTANFESAVDDTLCGGLLAVDENLVYQLRDRKSTRLNSSHVAISYAVFCLKKKELDNSSVGQCL